MHSYLSYKLSDEADKDLEDIYDYSVGKFGIEQTIKYLFGLENVFNNLCRHPKSGRRRDELWVGLRSISYVSHVVYYRIMKDNIRIVRILHSSRDVTKFLAF